jgi:hypothetical protein
MGCGAMAMAGGEGRHGCGNHKQQRGGETGQEMRPMPQYQ